MIMSYRPHPTTTAAASAHSAAHCDFRGSGAARRGSAGRDSASALAAVELRKASHVIRCWLLQLRSHANISFLGLNNFNVPIP